MRVLCICCQRLAVVDEGPARRLALCARSFPVPDIHMVVAAARCDEGAVWAEAADQQAGL